MNEYDKGRLHAFDLIMTYATSYAESTRNEDIRMAMKRIAEFFESTFIKELKKEEEE